VHFQGFWRLAFVLGLAQLAALQGSPQVQLVGVGGTFPLPLYSIWCQRFETTHPSIHINYLPRGSGDGLQALASGGADFAGTDFPMSDQQLLKAGVLHLPSVLGAIVPIYNLPNVRETLRFSPKALAGIYLGTITRWNDPVISGANPEVQLPSSKIAVIHSGDGRGTTYIWSDYLSKVSDEWKTRVGRGSSVKWPVGSEARGSGNLVKMVRETTNSIGFVELTYAEQNKLTSGQVQNAAGNFISADSFSINAAATAAARAMPSDFRASITNPPGQRSYPISSFTWIVIPENMRSPKREAMKDFLRWMLDEGQTYAESTGFTKLPAAVLEAELKAIEGLP